MRAAGKNAVHREPMPMSTTTRKVQLHYPLERLTEPVVTRLVNDFDVAPNILRADVNARTGGWLVVELTGDDARTDAALSWLREQGLVVTDTA